MTTPMPAPRGLPFYDRYTEAHAMDEGGYTLDLHGGMQVTQWLPTPDSSSPRLMYRFVDDEFTEVQLMVMPIKLLCSNRSSRSAFVLFFV